MEYESSALHQQIGFLRQAAWDIQRMQQKEEHAAGAKQMMEQMGGVPLENPACLPKMRALGVYEIKRSRMLVYSWNKGDHLKEISQPSVCITEVLHDPTLDISDDARERLQQLADGAYLRDSVYLRRRAKRRSLYRLGAELKPISTGYAAHFFPMDTTYAGGFSWITMRQGLVFSFRAYPVILQEAFQRYTAIQAFEKQGPVEIRLPLGEKAISECLPPDLGGVL